MAINVGDILASFRVIDEATEPLNQIAGAQEEVAATLTRLQSAYASAAGPVEDWNKLAEQFTGMPLAERANDMALAVEAVGGASRLTAQEQAQVNAVMEEALRKYQALGVEAPQAVKDLAEATRGASQAHTDWLAVVSKGVTVFAAMATAAIAGITAVGAAVIKIGEYGAGVGDITEQFGKLAEKAGVDATHALNALREATAGTISDLDLMKATLPLLSSGFKGSAEDLRVMAEAARVLAERGMGLNEAMGLVSSAMTTGRTRSLSLQGVVIDMQGAMKGLRDSTNAEGEAVENSASLHVKQQEILKGLKGLVVENGAVMDDFADKTDQVRVTFANFYNEFARRISESAALSTVFDRISTALSDAFGAEKAKLMDNLLAAFDKVVLFIGDVLVVVVEEGIKVFRWLREVVEGASGSGAWAALVSVFTAIWKILGLVWDVVSAVGKALLWLGEKLGVFAAIKAGFESMATGVGWLSTAVSWAVEKVRLLISIINDLRGIDPGLPKVTGGFADLAERGFKPVISASDALEGKLGPLTQGIGAVGGAAKLTAEQLKAMAEAEAQMSGAKQIAETQALIATYDRLVKQGLVPTIEAQKTLHASVGKSIAVMLEVGQKVPPSFLKVKDATAEAALGMDRWSAENVVVTRTLSDVALMGRTAARDLLPLVNLVSKPIAGLPPFLQWTGNGFAMIQHNAAVTTTSLNQMFSALGSALDNINSKFGQAAQAAGAAWDIISGVTQRKNPKTGEMESYDVGGKMVAGLGAAKEVLDLFVTGTDRAAVATRGMATGAVTGAAAVMGAYALMGASAGPIGIAIGATVGAIVGLVAAWNSAGAAARDANRAADKQLAALRVGLVQTYGSLNNVDMIGKQLGVDLAGAWGDTTVAGLEHFAKLVDEFEAKMTGLQKALEEYGLSWMDLSEEMKTFFAGKFGGGLVEKFNTLVGAGVKVETVTKKMSDEINAYVQNAIRAGVKIPAAMEPIIKKMIELGLVTKDTAALMMGLDVPNTLDWENALGVIEKYGGTLASLGPAFEAAKLSADWKSVGADWDYLIKAGGDMGGILFAMKDEIGKLVSESIRLGTEIPEHMRPLIEELIRTGQLIDDDGKKITETSKLKFGEVAKTDAQLLIDKLSELIEVLKVGLPGAFAGLANIRVPTVTVPWKLEKQGDDQEYPDAIPMHAGSGGFRDFGAGTLTMLHGRERVMTESETGGANMSVTIPVYLDASTKLTEIVMRRIGNRVLVAGVKGGI